LTNPTPLTPSECDLQDFAFMPLDVVRLRDSELAANETPEACWAAVLLWAAAWHQIPAASIPDDDRWIAKAAGYVARGKIDKAWPEIKPGAMRGFLLCTDGRWYHPVVAEKAREAWVSKLKQRWSTECARIKKANQRNKTEVQAPDFETWLSLGCPQGHSQHVHGDKPQMSPGTQPPCPSNVPPSDPSKGQGEGQGQGYNLNTPATTAREASVDIEVFAITAEWRPGPGLEAQAKLMGAPVRDEVAMAEGLGEFVAFWITRPGELRTQAQWENTLAKSLKTRAVRAVETAARQAVKPSRPAARQSNHGGHDAVEPA
jgi:hypothetical protein